MKNEDFIEASAYIRVLEKRMLNNAAINRIMDAPDALEALRLISQNCDYDFTALKRPEDYESVLKAALKDLYALMYKQSKHRAVVDIPAAKYDFHNLKTMIKTRHMDNKTSGGLSYLYSEISEITENKALPEHAAKAEAEAEEVFAESGDPQMIDIIADRNMFDYMLLLCDKIGNGIITEYVRLSIDMFNIKTLMRVKNMQKGTRFLNSCFASGGLTGTDFFLEHYDKSPEMLSQMFYYKYFGDMMKKGMDEYSRKGNLSSLEKLFDNRLIEHIKQSKYSAYGPEVLFAYIISKENEIRQIRILVTCKQNGIPVDTLKERLRDNYA